MKTILSSLLESHSKISSFLLVRHGQTDWNVAKKLQGHTDIPLNETGIAEAKAAGKILLNHQFDLCISSDLQRAYVTASYLTKLEIKTDVRLRERSFGKDEGASYKVYQEGSIDGESHMNTLSRIYGCLEEVALKHPNKQVLVTTHGGILKSILIDLLSLDCHPSKLFVSNLAALHITYDSGTWNLITTAGCTL
jgi:broad specificity phosphatase PhoE